MLSWRYSLKDKTIFISISAFNEEDLVSTIKNAIANAKYSNRLSFGIFYHNTDNEFKDLSQYTDNVYKTSHQGMLGVGVSRFLANQFYNGEHYYLQIDAHTIFDTWWDERLINDLENIKQSGISDKPIISYYLPSWLRMDDGSIELEKRIGFGSTLVWDHDQMNASYWDIPIMTTDQVDWLNEPHTFKRHYGIAAQFLFTDGSFCKDIVPDEQLVFYGEEPTLALRCFSAGYQVFTTINSYMWHKNKILSKNPNNDRLHFIPKDNAVLERYEHKRASSLAKTKKILTGEIVGYWGAANKEVLADYESKAEFSFDNFYAKMTSLEDTGVLWYEQ